MSESYRQCVACGKRALSFATRCPGCGVALPDPAPFGESATPRLTWSHSLKAAAGVLVIGGVLVSLERTPAKPAPLNAETSFVAVEASSPAGPRLDTTTVAAPAVETASVALIAKGWTHVRSRRSVNATLEAILTPGDTVVCDSLVKGWYRVALYGDVLGYAKEATLSAP